MIVLDHNIGLSFLDSIFKRKIKSNFHKIMLQVPSDISTHVRLSVPSGSSACVFILIVS